MPDHRKHRGKHPSDEKIFNSDQIVKLSEALKDFNYLLSRGYNPESALTLVGNRYKLVHRQRLAITYAGCDNDSLYRRKEKEISAEYAGDSITLDGYNFLITMESALSGAYIFEGTDGCYRDISGIHGNYRKVIETGRAIQITGHFLQRKSIYNCIWYLDQPVSNSGRLKSYIQDIAIENNWNWEVHLCYNPDKELIEKSMPVVTTDGYILNNCKNWINLAKEVLEEETIEVNLIKLL